MAIGSRTARGRPCEKCLAGSLERHVPRLFCPICSFRGDVRRRVRVGGGTVPCEQGPRLQGQAEKLGEELRRGKCRSTWDPQHPERCSQGRPGSTRQLRATANGRLISLIGIPL